MIITTTRLHLRTRDRLRTWLAQRDPIALAAMIALPLIVALALARQLLIVAPPISATPTPPLPIIIVATAPAQIPPTAAPIVVNYQAPPRYVVAFASPDGAVLGPVPEPQMSAITGRYGDGWISILWQGATVWLRTADLGANLANAAPAPTAAQPQVIYQVVNESPPPPPPPPAAEQGAYQIDNQPPAPAAPAPQIEAVPTAAPRATPQTVYPTLAPMEQTDTTRNWAAEQWRAEHP